MGVDNKNKMSVIFQGDMVIFCDFIQVFVFTTNCHLNWGNHIIVDELQIRRIVQFAF